MVKVSVVIPTKNAGPAFRETLEALRAQEYEGQIELAFVDSGSTDETITLAKSYGAIVKSIPPEEFNHGLTRNVGIEMSTGDIVILMSQDVLPGDRTLIKNFVDAFKDSKVAGAYARQLPRPEADILTKRNLNNWLTGRDKEEIRWIQDWESYKKFTPMQRHRFYNFDDVCSAIRKSVWEEIPFRANEFGEDIDWSQRALEAGWKIAYWPKSYVIHSHERSFMYDYKRNLQTAKKLCEQYDLCLVSSRRQLIALIWRITIRDWVYVIQNERRVWDFIKMMFSIPFLSVATIYGQYVGVKAAKSLQSADRNVTENGS